MIQGDWNAKIGKDAITDWEEPPINFQFNNKRERLLTPGICKNK